VLFFRVLNTANSYISKEGILGTTKLTRKEILAEDPVHHAIVRIVELFRERGKMIATVAAAGLLVVAGIFFGIQYLDTREARAQDQLARGMDFFHAKVDPTALDDPYGKGTEPLFRTEEAKYKAAYKEFSAVASSWGVSKLAIIARYYQGLTEMRLGRKEEGLRSLEAVRYNTKDRTVAFLARQAIADYYLQTGNPKGAREVHEEMIKDPQCMLPKAMLQLGLARALDGLGKRDEAIKILKEARDGSGRSMLVSLIVQELNKLEGDARQ
jgi:tetratricopeptide (TPR) repeat protein